MIDASPAPSTPPTRQAILAPELLLADRVDALTEALRHEEHLVQTLLATVRMAQERIDALTAENRDLRQQIEVPVDILGATPTPSAAPSTPPTATPTLYYGHSALT